MSLYRIEVVRYIRQCATVHVSADESPDFIIDPQASEAIKDKADDTGFETDWEYVSDYDISYVEEISDPAAYGINENEIIHLEEIDNG